MMTILSAIARVRKRRAWLRKLRNEQGSSLVELALIAPMFVLMLVAVVDFGKAYFLVIEVSAAAEAGALYGTLNPTDTSGMQTAAVLDAADVSGMVATATAGCECSDGTSAVANCTSAPSCTVNVVNYVQVSTSVTYSPILMYPGIPSSFALKGKARLRTGH